MEGVDHVSPGFGELEVEIVDIPDHLEVIFEEFL